MCGTIAFYLLGLQKLINDLLPLLKKMFRLPPFCQPLVIGIDVMSFIIKDMNSGPLSTLIISDRPLGSFKNSSTPMTRIVGYDRSKCIIELKDVHNASGLETIGIKLVLGLLDNSIVFNI